MACRGCIERAEMVVHAKKQLVQGKPKEAVKTVGKVVKHAVKEVKMKFGGIS